MLQQTQVRTVIPYYERWLRALPDVAALAQADAAQLHKLWEGLGYYTRVRNLQRAARHILAHHGGSLPESFDDVLALPGIGRYTAGAICSLAFHQPTPIVDGNVARVLSRIFGLRADPRAPAAARRHWQLAETLVHRAAASRDPAACAQLNSALMELGALVCTPRSPACDDCPVRRLCAAARSGAPEQFPLKSKRPAVTARRVIAFVVQRGKQVLLRQRPDGVVNAGLWEFPNFEPAPDAPFDLPGEPLEIFQHSITRYRITLEARRATLPQIPAVARSAEDRWVALPDLEALAFTSAHRRLLRHLTL